MEDARISEQNRSYEAQALLEEVRKNEQNRSYEAQALLEESRKRTRLIEEQGISEDYAYRKGLEIENLTSGLFNNDFQFYFESPYLSQKLSESFASGVEQKIKDTGLDLELNSKPINIVSEKIISQLGEHALLARAFVLKYGKHTNDVLNKLSNQYSSKEEALWVSQDCQIKISGVRVNFGALRVRLAIDFFNDSGRIQFKNQYNRCVTENETVNLIFDEAFDSQSLLTELNDPKIRGERIRASLVAKTNELEMRDERIRTSLIVKINELEIELSQIQVDNREAILLIFRRLFAVVLGFFWVYKTFTYFDNFYITLFVFIFSAAPVYVLLAMIYVQPRLLSFRNSSDVRANLALSKKRLNSIKEDGLRAQFEAEMTDQEQEQLALQKEFEQSRKTMPKKASKTGVKKGKNQ
jgi:hypothetical protein